MSRASHQTAINDFNALHDKPPQLTQAMVQHRSEPFYLSEIVALAGGQADALAKAGGQADVWKDAKKAHDQIQEGRNAAKQTNTAMLIQQMSGLGWSGPGAEALVSELFNERRLEKFGNDVKNIEPEYSGILGNVIGKAVADGLVPASAVVDFNGQGWDARVQSDREKQSSLAGPRQGAMTEIAEHQAAADLTTKRKTLDDAEKKLRDLDNELSKQLAGDNVGLTLTNEKKVEYIHAFQNKDEYKKAVAQVNAASQALGLTLQRDGGDLAAFGADGKDPVQAGQAGGDLMATYRSLAQAPHNSVLLAKVADAPPAALRGNKKELGELADRSLEIDQPLEFAGLREIFEAAEAKEKGSGLLAVLEQAKKRLVEPYEAFKQFSGLAKVGTQIDQALPAFRDYLKVRDTLSQVQKKEQLGNVIKIFGGEEDRASIRVGKGLAALIGGATDAGEFAKTGQLQALANAVLGNGREFLAAANAGKDGAELAAAAEGVGAAGFELKLLPMMAIALGGVQLFSDGKNFAKTKNPADLVAGVGDAISIVGGAVMCVPGLQPVGEAINVVGAAITFVAHIFRGDPEGDKRRKDEKGTLEATNAYGNATGEVAKTLTDKSAKGALDRISKDSYHWSPEEIQALARDHSFLFTEDRMLDTADNLRKFYMQDKNGGLFQHTQNLHQFITAIPGDKMKQILEIASRSNFAMVANEWDVGMVGAIYYRLQQCFDKSQWKNSDPWFKQSQGML